ncbi:hypothetical protein P5V15_000964 [Pogonomyrmex californicus]
MHPTLGLSSNVPAFLAKLWKLVEDPDTDHLIFWSPSGKSFFIRDQAKFARDLLPHYYKHNNMASFIRQLNMYGFHKKVSVELGGLKCDKDDMEFAHQYFIKDRPYLVEHIKRKIASNKNQDSTHSPIKSEIMNKVLNDVRNMKDRQEDMDNKLSAMKLENATLWGQLVALRQKHLKQQQIVNKLIHFLVTLVQPSRGGLSVKRRYPLMIDDSSCPHKQSKVSKPQASPTGPVIHELDASDLDVNAEYIAADILESETPNVQSPQEQYEIDDEKMEAVHLIKDSIQNPEIDKNKKYIIKGKKKRKDKVPIRISIPPLENGEKPREELHMLELGTDEDEPMAVALLKNESIGSKPVPMATVRSSKLAAMAANINKSQDEHDTDMNIPTELEDMEASDNDASMVKLEDILIVPEMLNDNIQNNIENKQDNNNKSNKATKRLNQIDGGKSVLVTNNNEKFNENKMINCPQKEKNSDKTDASSSKNLSVSCVNFSGKSEANYRLEPTEEMDSHLETIQNDLGNLHEYVLAEKYNIDANVANIFGQLFSGDELFGLSINSELAPNCGREDDNINVTNGSTGGELMTYNSSSNLLDFDDIFLENPSLSNPDLPTNSQYSDLDLEESKLLDSSDK